jgi:hypothetical protein
MEEMINAYRILLENQEGRGHLVKQDLDVGIILKRI